MRKNPALYFLWLFILVGLSCRTNTSGPSGEPVIFGVVRDSLGSPVSSAYLNFVFRFRSIITNQIYADTPGTGVTVMFQFQNPSRAFIDVSIENYIGNPIRTLVSDTLGPGVYQIQWDGKDQQQRDVYSDGYYFKRTVNSSLVEKTKIVLVTAQHLSSNPAPYVQTDGNGRFTIPLSRLPVNEIFIRTINEPTPVDSIKLDDIQTLYAFDSTHYGRSTISLSNSNEVIITLNIRK